MLHIWTIGHLTGKKGLKCTPGVLSLTYFGKSISNCYKMLIFEYMFSKISEIYFTYLLLRSSAAHPLQSPLCTEHRTGHWPRKTGSQYFHQTLGPVLGLSCLTREVKDNANDNTDIMVREKTANQYFKKCQRL